MIHLKNTEKYNEQHPFPHHVQDNTLDKQFAEHLKDEILSLDESMWDRYNNPFEQKYTLRDKYNFPPLCKRLFEFLESDGFINTLSNVVGTKLCRDTERMYWGIHKASNGDYLDIHVDAGIHPIMKKRKYLTLGIYLSTDWSEENKGFLELWSGESADKDSPKLDKCEKRVLPLFNRLILFTCNDVSWHGTSEKIMCDDEQKRIFLTMSYLSENDEFLNKKKKAFFVALPNEEYDAEKDKLRRMRCDEKLCKQVYNIQPS